MALRDYYENSSRQYMNISTKSSFTKVTIKPNIALLELSLK